MAVINNRQPHLPASWLQWEKACVWQFLGISRMASFHVLDGGTEAVLVSYIATPALDKQRLPRTSC